MVTIAGAIHTKIIYVMLAMLPAANGTVMSHLEYSSMAQCEKAMAAAKFENTSIIAACVMGDVP